MDSIKASEARKQWKELLDRASNGEVVRIERSGITFHLGTMFALHNEIGRQKIPPKGSGNVHTSKGGRMEPSSPASTIAIEAGRKLADKKRERSTCPHGNEIGKCTSRMCNAMLSR